MKLTDKAILRMVSESPGLTKELCAAGPLCSTGVAPFQRYYGPNSHRKRGETDRPRLRSTAPALDPTGCRLPLVEERLRIRRPTKNGLDAPAVLCIDLSRRSSNVLLRAVACWSTEVRQVLDDRLRRRTFLLPIPPRTQLRPYHMVDSSALGPCIDFENAR